jgi:hypothetical protein
VGKGEEGVKRRGLTVDEHIEVGTALKRARALIHEAARTCRVYGRLSRELYDCADALMKPRAWLTERLLEEVESERAMVDVREVYFGELVEAEEDA